MYGTPISITCSVSQAEKSFISMSVSFYLLFMGDYNYLLIKYGKYYIGNNTQSPLPPQKKLALLRNEFTQDVRKCPAVQI